MKIINAIACLFDKIKGAGMRLTVFVGESKGGK